MKFYRSLIILAVVAGLLAGAYYFVSRNVQSVEEKTDIEEEQIVFNSFGVDEISKVAITNKTEKIVIEKSGDLWVVTSPAGVKTDSEKAAKIPGALAAFSADQVAVEDSQSSSLADYGLDAPTLLTYTKTDATESTVAIGSQTPVKSGYYAMVSGDPKIYVISDETAAELLKTKNDILDTTLFAVEAADIMTLTMNTGEKNSFRAVKGENEKWFLVSPIAAQGSAEAFGAITAALGYTKNYKELIEENPQDLSKYGLDKPAYTFTFASVNGNHMLLLGNEKVKGESYYAMIGGRDEVFTIDSYRYNFMDMPLKEMLDLFVYMPSGMGDVLRMTVETGGVKTVCSLDVYEDTEGKADTSKDIFKVNGKDVTMAADESGTSLFRIFYKNATGLLMDEVDIESVPSGEAEISVTYHLKSEPGVVKLQFVPKENSNFYYVIKDGVYTGKLVSKDKEAGVNLFIGSLEKIIEASEQAG